MTRRFEPLAERCERANIVGSGFARERVGEPSRGDAVADLVARGQLVDQTEEPFEVSVGVAGVDDAAASIDRLPIFLTAKATDRVVVFEAEPDGIHELVARMAIWIGGVVGVTLARGQLGIGLGRP